MMDIVGFGTVCGACRSFSEMGQDVCASCGASITLGADDEAGEGAGGPVAADGRNCPRCDTRIPDDYTFCGRCGASLTGPLESAPEKEILGVMGPEQIGQDADRTEFFHSDAVDTGTSRKARLVVVKGEGIDGMTFALRSTECIAGRNVGQVLFPDDSFASRRHVTFYYKDQRLHVRDEGSTNGVFFRVTSTMALQHGDLFLVGEQLMRFDLMRLPEDTPNAEGTYFLGSRRRTGAFRLVQLFPSRDEGLTYVARTDAISIGREGCDINFPTDRFISRSHARIDALAAGGGFELVDLDSRNGTYVKLSAECVLEHGDHVFIGQQLLRMEL